MHNKTYVHTGCTGISEGAVAMIVIMMIMIMMVVVVVLNPKNAPRGGGGGLWHVCGLPLGPFSGPKRNGGEVARQQERPTLNGAAPVGSRKEVTWRYCIVSRSLYYCTLTSTAQRCPVFD